MKTAISIPDKLFKEVDATARRLGMSRSELFSKAVAVYIEQHRARRVTAALDRVYAANGSTLEPALSDLQRRSVDGDGW